MKLKVTEIMQHPESDLLDVAIDRMESVYAEFYENDSDTPTGNAIFSALINEFEKDCFYDVIFTKL